VAAWFIGFWTHALNNPYVLIVVIALPFSLCDQQQLISIDVAGLPIRHRYPNAFYRFR
jgi:hypothetical protein